MRRIRESTLDRLQVLEEGGQAARGVGAVDIVHVTEANPARNDSHLSWKKAKASQMPSDIVAAYSATT